MNCRHCGAKLKHTFVNLEFAPPTNAYLNPEDLDKPEIYYPLHLKVCDQCWLVQTLDYTKADSLFTSEYAYFSSTSSMWLEHARQYFKSVTNKLKLNATSYVIEVASNDGYLLKNFVAAGIPCLGIEPTDSTAQAAENVGIPVLREFFGKDLAKKLKDEGKQADLITGNNVYAHVPDLNDFTNGLKEVLKPQGTITLEFPHLKKLIENTLFDTVYHEHFSYFSLFTVCRVFKKAGLRIYDTEKLWTHGGSLRIYGCHQDDPRNTKQTVNDILAEEAEFGLLNLKTYLEFQDRVNKIKNKLIGYLLEQKNLGKQIAAYGAAAKGNTLLNYAGIKPDLLPYVCDAAPSKQGKFLPGSHIPIKHPQVLKEQKPDIVLILPWNIKDEVCEQNIDLIKNGTKFLIAVPKIREIM
jgi:SAM-dependent methyltransferase